MFQCIFLIIHHWRVFLHHYHSWFMLPSIHYSFGETPSCSKTSLSSVLYPVNSIPLPLVKNHIFYVLHKWKVTEQLSVPQHSDIGYCTSLNNQTPCIHKIVELCFSLSLCYCLLGNMLKLLLRIELYYNKYALECNILYCVMYGRKIKLYHEIKHLSSTCFPHVFAKS